MSTGGSENTVDWHGYAAITVKARDIIINREADIKGCKEYRVYTP